MRRALAWIGASLVALAGCTSGDDASGGSIDASIDVPAAPGLDASIDVAVGSRDAGRDANGPDTNQPDTDQADTNLPDTNLPDTNLPDTNVPDNNVPDTNVPDTSPPDAGIDADESGAPDAGPATMLGPTPYLSVADSPFASIGLATFYLEDFEDHLLNTPGASVDVGQNAQPFGSLIDSVDGDDGAVDGVCAKTGNCDDWFSGNGSAGVTYTFDAAALGGLPTHAGVVWTDGGGQVTFQAYDANGNLLGQVGPISDASFPDGSFSGTVAEDRFFGCVYAGGIKSIHVANSGGGIESDHLQYGR